MWPHKSRRRRKQGWGSDEGRSRAGGDCGVSGDGRESIMPYERMHVNCIGGHEVKPVQRTGQAATEAAAVGATCCACLPG
jgi:hypothetical protein